MKTIPYAPGTWRTVHKNTMVIYLADNVTSDAALLLCERLCTEHKMEVRRNGNLTIRARSPRSKDGEAFYVDFKTGQHATKGNMLLVEYDNGEQVDVGETVATILVVVLVSVVIGLLVGGAVNAGSHHGGCGGGGGHHHHHSGGGGGHHHHHSGGGGGHHHHHHHHQHHHRSSNFIMPLYISSSFSSSSSSSRTYTRQLRSGVQATVTYDEYNNPQRQMSPVPCTDFATRQAFFYYFFENLAAAAHSLEYAQVPYDASPLMLQAMPLTPHKALEGHTNDGATFYSVYVPDDATVRVDIAGAANLLVRAVKGDHRPKWYSGGQARPFATANFSQALVLASGAWTVGVWHAKMGVHTTFHIAMSEPVALEQSVEAAMGDSLSSLDCLRPSAPPQYDTLDASGSSTSAVPTKSGEQETEEDDEGEGEDEGWTLLDAETIAKDVVATTRRTYGPASFRQVGLTRKTENT